jgi:hypothetical protein
MTKLPNDQKDNVGNANVGHFDDSLERGRGKGEFVELIEKNGIF